jgi:membrane protein DedA with SNARE-associated domain
LGYYLGGPIIKKIIHKYGKYIFLKESHYTTSEKFFLKHGEISTFLGRFIPGVRSLISFPPGIFKMNPLRFAFYTLFAGSIANSLLIGIGYIAGQNEALIKKLTSELMLVLIVFCGTLISLYVWYVKSHKKELQEIEEVIEDNTQ